MDRLKGYEVLQERPLRDIRSGGAYLIHKKSGARVAVIENDDPNKVFYIGFRTPPSDDCGIPHIIEHTVLCGSRKFPVKDPFIELAKGSMNTFLNAMTYPDKTVYPVASCNGRDFQNLMDVYMDAVLHPNIYREKNIFRQEGWHYEITAPGEELTINGVVYNEMKGAFSVGDAVVERGIRRALYPATPYRHESGGDPDAIPDLTYGRYLDFHRTYYHPSNAYIYLYGDMDAAEKLNWLDEEYLSSYERSDVRPRIPKQPPFREAARRQDYYSISGAEDERDNTYLSFSWSLGTNLDPLRYVAFDILDYALLDSHGAPLKQALLDAGVGDDIRGGYDSGIFQPYFSVIAKHANPEDEDKFRRIIFDVLSDRAKNGIDRATLLAGVNGAEFKFREADYGRYPKGLLLGLQILDSWLYDDSAPFLHVDELGIYENLRKKMDTSWFEDLLRTYFLENRHACALRVIPRRDLNAARDKALAKRLRARRDSMGGEAARRLIEESRELSAYQKAAPTKEELDTIPLLSRDDMKKTSDPYSNVEDEAEGIHFLWHDYETNGIIYLDYLFDTAHIREERVPYLGILRTLLGMLDTKDHSFVDLSNEIDIHTGGISAEANVFPVLREGEEYEAKLEIRIRTLEANLPRALDLARSMMLRTLFDDEKRVFEVLAQERSRLFAQIRENGNRAAASRALSYVSEQARYSDLLTGIGQYRLLSRIVSAYDTEKERLRGILYELIRDIMQPGGLTVSCTCKRQGFELVRGMASRIAEGLCPDTEKTPEKIMLPTRVNEGFTDASRVQYVALAGNFKKSGIPWRGLLRVFRCVMSYEYLWQNIRVRGGAYGCGCYLWRTGDVCFSSFRDPNLSRTLEVYRGVADYLRNFAADERDMTRYIIGTFSEMDAPLTPCAMGRRSLEAKLGGLTFEMIQSDREEILSADPRGIRSLAEILEPVIGDARICVIGNEEKLKSESDVFEHMEAL